MDHFSLIFEVLGIFLGGMVFATKAIPELKRFTAIVQVSWFFYTLLKEYLKRNPEKRQQLHILVASMTNHYFKTHPYGKVLAKQTDIDEKIELVLRHDSEVHGVG